MTYPEPSDFNPRQVRATCLALHLQKAARVVNRLYDEALRPAGITINQFSLLVSLARPEPPALGRLASELAMDRTTLTANLKPLQSRKLVRSLKDPEDGRSRLLLLTEAGHAAISTAAPLWRQAQASMRERLRSIESTYADLREIGSQ